MEDNTGLVPLGGILSAAVRAYETKEQERVVEVRELRAALESEREERAEQVRQTVELQKVLQKLQSEINALKARKLLSFPIEDVAGVWFDTHSNVRVTVTDDGDCSYDCGSKQCIVSDSGTLKLGDDYFLSQDESSRTRLIWEASGKPTVTWGHEVPGCSRQVVLTVDVTKMIAGHKCFERGQFVLQRFYEYPFSVLGCEINLVLSRNTKAADGSWVAGDSFLGVHFGLLRSTINVGSSPNSVDAIRCGGLFELWDPINKSWRFLARSDTRRYEKGAKVRGYFDTVPFNEFEIFAEHGILAEQGRGGPSKTCKFRVTLTDIGLLELTTDSVQPILPINA